jgi:hypothetical protein
MVQCIRSCGCPSALQGISLSSCKQQIRGIAQRVWNAIASVFKCFFPCLFKQAPSQSSTRALETVEVVGELDTSDLEAALKRHFFSDVVTILEFVGRANVDGQGAGTATLTGAARQVVEKNFSQEDLKFNQVFSSYGLEQSGERLEGRARQIFRDLQVSLGRLEDCEQMGAIIFSKLGPREAAYGLFVFKEENGEYEWWFFNPNRLPLEIQKWTDVSPSILAHSYIAVPFVQKNS